MKNLKKIITLFICISFLFACTSQSKEETQTAFQEFLDGLPSRFLSNDDFNLEFQFKNPSDFGFEEALLELPYSDIEDYKKSNQDAQDILKELSQFKYKNLTEEQQLTYDILQDYLERNMIDEKFYYLSNSYLGSFIGFQAQLPLLLNEYTFERENDLDSYFHILETSPDIFKKYADMEKERQAHGVGMSQDILDKVIEQCDNFSKDKEPFLIDSINQKIDQVDFLDDQQKQEAKAKNEKLLKENYIQAYELLGRELRTIQGSEQEVGLANVENGKEYYELLLKASTGIDDSVEDIQKYFEKKLRAKITEMTKLAVKHPNALNNFDNPHYTSAKTFEENLNELNEKIKNDFPATEAIPYDVTIVPDSMKENFSPAAYLLGKIDADPKENGHIWVNGEYEESLYTTLAHEGFPGHMYQDTYFRRLQLPTIRYLLDYSGYNEGWATYVENNAYQYANVSEEEKAVLELLAINQEATGCLICLMDIGIHYEGWSYDDYLDFMQQYFEIDDEESLKEQYDLIIETPTNYLTYFLNGMKYQDLYDDAKKQLGDKFNTVEFHKVILDTGPAPYVITKQQVDKYIDSQS